MRASAFFAIVLLASLAGARVSAQQTALQSVSASDRQILASIAFPGHPVDEPLKCGLSLVAALEGKRASLSGEVQEKLQRLLMRVERQKSITAGRFTVHYDTSGLDAATMLDGSYQPIPGSANVYADSVAAIANRVYTAEVAELGYLAPPSDGPRGGGPAYDIYVENLGFYGETIAEEPLDSKPTGGRYITYMRIDNDFSFVRPEANKGLPGLRVTLAHEFHHMIQLGSYGYWGEDPFYYEITSTWMEDVVYPGVNDYLNYLKSSGGHFRNPDKAFNTANGLIEYSRAIWGHFIAARFGSDMMRAALNNVMTVRPLEAIDLALHAATPNPTTFKAEFAEWVLWNYYTGSRADSSTYYPSGAIYPEIVQLPAEFVPPSGMLTGSVEALSARYHQVFTPVDTVVIVQCNINRESAEGHSGSTFPYSITLSSSQVDGSYEPAGNMLFISPSVSDPTNWKTLKIVQGVASLTGIAEGTPYPNPFRPNGTSVLFIPAQAASGTLYIYSSSMDLIYSAAQTSVVKGGKSMFTWNGHAHDDNPAKSGIYVFVLSIPGKTITGKIALIRN